jgi:hypothetical protein
MARSEPHPTGHDYSFSREDPIPVPVLKMPPERALSSLRILASPLPEPAKRAALTALSPGIKERTSLYAYALPSLTELGLYEGRSGTGM